MKVYTRRGDDGTTGLLHGGRVDKDDLRTEAYGTVDEAVSVLGLARATLGTQGDERWPPVILAVQRDLFVVGAQLATAAEHWGHLEDGVSRVTDGMVERLEGDIDRMVEEHPLPRQFVVPGEHPAGAALDLARTVVRRAERAAVRLHRDGLLPDVVVVRYLNRLSDFLFVLARAVEGGAFTPSRQR